MQKPCMGVPRAVRKSAREVLHVGERKKKEQSGGREGEKRQQSVGVVRLLGVCRAVQSCCHGECVGVRAECLFFLVAWGMPLSFAKVCTCERGWKRF